MSKLPLVARKAIRDDLEPQIHAFEALMKKIFEVDFVAEYDLPTVFSQLEARFAEEEGEKWTRWYTQAPQYVGRYFVELAKGLEEQKFGKDEMLKEGLLEAADKKVVTFNLVKALPSKNKTYHEVTVEDGKLNILSTFDNFGCNISSVAEGIVNTL